MNNGMFGTLFCVQHTVTGEVWTAKHMRADPRSVRREAAILYKVRNEPTIIALYALYTSPKSSVIVTDFMVGGDLVERTARTDFVLNESKCKNYVRQICEGLRHVHACGVVHLDLKPFSIVFTGRDEDAGLKITDFGLARWMPKEGPLKVTQMCGSLEFISPEVLECTEATTSTDCWGIGVIAYMLITGGRSPFYGGNRFRTMGKILMAQGGYYLSMQHRAVSKLVPDHKYRVRQQNSLLEIEKTTALVGGDLASAAQCRPQLHLLWVIL